MVYLPLMWANIPYGSCGKQVISQKNTCHNIFQTRNLRPSVLGSGIASSSWGAGSVPQPRFHWMNIRMVSTKSAQDLRITKPRDSADISEKGVFFFLFCKVHMLMNTISRLVYETTFSETFALSFSKMNV